MSFTPDQIAALDAPLSKAAVKERTQAGRTLSYVEGWHVIAEANRIFGFDGWSRETITLTETNRDLVTLTGRNGEAYQQWRIGYVAKVRVTVGGTVREGTGYGSGMGKPEAIGDAVEGAIKEAETDAMKRAMMTFGNPFGLALYDKTQENVEKPEPPTTVRVQPKPAPKPAEGDQSRAEALGALVRQCGSIDALEALRGDPGFRLDFKALSLAQQATVGEVIKKKRQQFEEAA